MATKKQVAQRKRTLPTANWPDKQNSQPNSFCFFRWLSCNVTSIRMYRYTQTFR
ncbi:MAG: hypothetical protein V3571_09170 [Pseudodesulfovibrio sp.]